MSESNEERQWDKLGEIERRLGEHEKQCAEWRGGMTVKMNILLWLVGTCTVAFATAGAAHLLPKLFGG